MPDDSSRELLAGLDAVGVQTLKYRTGDDADRVEHVNSVQQARFSPGSAQKRTGRTNSDSGVIWAGSDTSQSASLTAAPLRQSDSRSLAGPPIAPLPRNRLAFSAAGGASPVFPLKGSQSNSSSGVLWAGSESGQLQAGVAAARWAESLQSKPGNDTMGKTSLKSLTEAERGALLRYKSSESYKVNAKLRDGITLTEAEQKMVAALDSALEKLPRVEGTVYRTLDFDDVFDPRKEYEDFIAQHAVGMFARYKAYTSASTKTDGYPLPDETKYGVTLEIVSQNARDLADIGNNFESEALFPRRSVFDISKVETDKGGRIRIYMEEVQVNGRDKHHEHDSQKRGVAVRDLQKAHSAHADLQGVPRADPRGDHGRGKNLQGTGEKVKFSLKSPVEESGDLIALHNLTEAEQRTISDAQARFSPGSAQRRTGRTNSDSGVLWRGSETAMDSPDQAVYNEAGKGQSTSSSNSSSGILWAGSDEMPHEGDSETSKNKISDNDSITGHIFRDAEGHIPDTPENRALLEDVANDPANFRGTDKYGNEWYTKIQSDGSQVWVESRNGNIFEGGINNTPKLWNLETGLKKP